jgi:hypothetical protein
MKMNPIHHEGMLECITATMGMDLSSLPPADLAPRRPRTAPTATTRSVPVVKSSIVLGRYAIMMSTTNFEPFGACRKKAVPRWNSKRFVI